MSQIITKINEYQQELYKKLGKREYTFTPEEEIQLGDNLYICGICLGDEKNWFGVCYMSNRHNQSYISLYCLSDCVLNEIAHILRKQL